MIQRTEYINRLLSYKDKQIIKVLTGIRRSGKSTLMMMFQDELKKCEVSNEQIIYINLEDMAFSPLQDYLEMYEYISNLLCDEKMNYIFIDEIQNCDKFQKVIDSLHLKKNVDIYLTGSNASMLSGELATLLSGRYITIEVLPLSFGEYLKGVGGSDKQEKFRDYVRFGSFPYTLEFNSNESQIMTYLEGLYDTIFLRDIISRNKIKDAFALKDVMKFIFDNIGNITSSKKISDSMISAGRKLSQPTIDSYLNYICECYMAYKVDRYDVKGKEYLKSLSKYYVTDIGLRNFLLGYKQMDEGHILENLVYLELRRRGYKIYVGKVGELEIDFVAINSRDQIYVQVASTVKDPQVLERELRSFKAVEDYYKRVLISGDYDYNDNYDGIKHMNVIDFLSGGEL